MVICCGASQVRPENILRSKGFRANPPLAGFLAYWVGTEPTESEKKVVPRAIVLFIAI